MHENSTSRAASRGAIAAGDPQTAEAGAKILRVGGNAVDAAVAAAFASFVIEFPLANIGGSGIATVADTQNGKYGVYDFFSDMPSGELMPCSDFRQVTIDYGPTTQPFYIGRASVAVPGAVAGLSLLAEKHGSLPLSTLLQPAIQFAREGVVLSEPLSVAYQMLQPIFNDSAELADIYVPQGRPLHVGQRKRFPQLADTLEKLAQCGAGTFYHGDLARAIIEDQQMNGGLLTAEDLADYSVDQLDPISIDYRDFTILLPPPSSTGGVLTAFALLLLHELALDDVDHNGVYHIRVLAEVLRQTNAARASWEADSAPPQQRVKRFLSRQNVESYVHRLTSALVETEHASEPAQRPESGSTTHITVADGNGQVVSITTSAGENAGFVVGDTGVCLNNMLGEIDLHPDGFHKVPPGMRLSTMMTPTVVLHNGTPMMAVGSGGANRIRSAVLQTISNILDFGLNANDAVNAPRVHFENNVLQLEGGIDASAVAELSGHGYKVNVWDSHHMYFGGAHMVLFHNGVAVPAGDRRRGGATAIVS